MPNHDAKPNNVAILIDIENINDVKWVKAVLGGSCQYGNVMAKRAVGNWTSKGEKVQNELTELGVGLIHQHSTGKGNNSSDMRMAIEAMDLLHDPTVSIDVFVLATSDVDFVPLATRLRSAGKHVVGYGHEKSKELWRKSVDEFTLLGGTKNQGNNGPAKSVVGLLPKKTVKLIRQALEELIETHPDKVTGSRLKGRIRELDPNFDQKNYGHRSFKKLVQTLPFAKIPGTHKSGDFRITLRKSK